MENFGNSAPGLVIAVLLCWAAITPDKVGEWIAKVEQSRAALEEKETQND